MEANSCCPDCRKPCARSSKSRGSIKSFKFSQTRMLRVSASQIGKLPEDRGIASDTDALQRDLCQNLKRLRDILRNIELRCALDVSLPGCLATRGLRPEVNSVTQADQICCLIDNRSVLPVFDDFAKPVGTCCDYR